ncbi:MAG: cation transporting ATPase C-terminal domain-containing protein [Desulfobacteraceae bacterium]
MPRWLNNIPCSLKAPASPRGPERRAAGQCHHPKPLYVGGIGFCILLLLAAVYVPGLSQLLRTEAPGFRGWLVILGMSFLPFVVGQILRRVQKEKEEKMK